MDFLRDHAHLAGGDTRKERNIRDLAISRQTYGGQGGDTRQLHAFSNLTPRTLHTVLRVRCYIFILTPRTVANPFNPISRQEL